MKIVYSKLTFFVLVLAAGTSLTCFKVPDGKGEYEVYESVHSPSNRFTAYYWIWMGGGAAGWCYKKVTILRSTEELPLATEPEKAKVPFVFSIRCSSKIRLAWIDDNQIKIGHSLGDDPFPTSMMMASQTEDGSVKIVYEIIEK